MNDSMLRSWWPLAVRGLLAVICGVLALAWPGPTLLLLVAIFGSYALLGGAVWVFVALKNRPADGRWWVPLLLGAVSIMAGGLAVVQPAAAALALVLLLGANALVCGVLDLVVALRLRRHIRGEFLLLLSGVVSIVFGLVVLMFPEGAGALALAWMVGMYAMLTGVLLLALALRVRAWSRLNAARSSPAADSL